MTGGGWDLPLFPRADPRKEDLDALVPDRPAFMDSADGHSAWVNSRALALAGVTADTPDPEGGRIERDPETGQPTGTLRESAAGLVERFVPELSPQDYIKGLKAGLALANRFGIASIVEASADVPILDAYAALDRDGELTVRVLASLYVDTRRGVSEAARARRPPPALRGTAAPVDRGQDLRRRRHGTPHGRPPRTLRRPPGRSGHAASRTRGLRRPGRGARPGRLPDPRPRHRRPGRPHVARRRRGRRTGQRLPGHAPPHRPPRAHRSRRHPPLPAAGGRGQLPGALGLRRHLHHRSDPAASRAGPLALALSDRQRRRDRGRDRRRERLVGLLHEPARGHPGRADPEGPRRPSRRAVDTRRDGRASRPCSGPTP